MPRRRLLLSAPLALAGLSLAGCDIRLEEDAPNVPFIPRRTPMAGELVLLDLLAGTIALSAAATADTDPLSRDLSALLDRQAQVVRDALLGGGVPAEIVGTPEAGPSPALTLPASFPAALRSTVGDAARFDIVPDDFGRVLLALCAQRLAAATLLDVAAGSAEAAASTPAGGVRDEEVLGEVRALGELLTVQRQAVHFFEVVQARAPADTGPTGVRARAVETTQWLAPRIEHLSAQLGDQAPEAPVAIALPFPVATPEDMENLGKHALGEIRAAQGRVVESLTPAGDRQVWVRVPPDLADIEVRAHSWGVALQAFPGLA